MVLKESGEDYLETILELSQDSKTVRSVDIASKMGVSKPSVNKAMNILKNHGYVEQEPYQGISLTEKGRAKAKDVYHRHKIIMLFLVDILGVDRETADKDACKIEHVVSKKTMDKLTEYITKVE